MLERVINNYLTKALIRCFETVALKRRIDLYATSNKGEVSIYVKDKRHLFEMYKKVMIFNKSASIYYLCNLVEAKKGFDEILKKYQEREC